MDDASGPVILTEGSRQLWSVLAIAGHRSSLSLDQMTPHTAWDGQGLAYSVKGEHVRVEVRVGAHV